MQETEYNQNGYDGVLGGLIAAKTSSKLNHRYGDWNMAAAAANRNIASAAAAATEDGVECTNAMGSEWASPKTMSSYFADHSLRQTTE